MIKWNCPYCRKPQETPDLPLIPPQTTPYAKIIADAVTGGTIACYACWKAMSRR